MTLLEPTVFKDRLYHCPHCGHLFKRSPEPPPITNR